MSSGGQEEQPAETGDSYNHTDFSLPVEVPHPWKGWAPTPAGPRATIQGYDTIITAMLRTREWKYVHRPA